MDFKFKKPGSRKRPIPLDESGSEEGTKGRENGLTMSGGKKPAKPQKRVKQLTKRRKTTNDKAIADKASTSNHSDSDDSPLSDGMTALKKVKEAQEKRENVRKGPQSNTLQHFSTPKATMSDGAKRWSFKCKYCPR
jgi:hypothetical protein